MHSPLPQVHRCKPEYPQTDRQAGSHVGRQTHRQEDIMDDRDKQETDRQAGRWADRYKQTDRTAGMFFVHSMMWRQKGDTAWKKKGGTLCRISHVGLNYKTCIKILQFWFHCDRLCKPRLHKAGRDREREREREREGGRQTASQ